jgi:hypothetical protein
MADVYGVNTTKVNAGTSQDNWVDQGLIKSSLKIMSETYTAAALAAGQTIGVANLPDGAVVHGGIIYFGALGAGVTLQAGDANTVGLYSSAIVCTAAGSALFDIEAGSGYVIGSNAGDNEIILTTGVGAATGEIKVVIFYTN